MFLVTDSAQVFFHRLDVDNLVVDLINLPRLTCSCAIDMSSDASATTGQSRNIARRLLLSLVRNYTVSLFRFLAQPYSLLVSFRSANGAPSREIWHMSSCHITSASQVYVIEK